MKILIIAEEAEVERYRTKRILEEIEKKGLKAKVVVSSHIVISIDGIFYNDKEIKFDNFQAIYSVGNSTYHHYVIRFASFVTDILMWPSNKHLSMNDKFFEGMFMASIDVPTPKTVLLNSSKEAIASKLVDEVGGYPCVIKKVSGSEGRYVDLINSHQELKDFIKRMPHPSISGRKNILLQEYIEESKGTDFRVYCVGEKVLGAIKRTASDDNFKANISLGGSAEQVEMTGEMIDYSKKIMKEGRLLFAGIDFIKSNGGYLALEINTSADFMGFENATGRNVAGEIIDAFISKYNAQNIK